jgi:cytochrome c-type biogenesis protein CcmH
MMALVVATLGIMLPGTAWAQSGETSDAYDEAKAQEIDRMLMCPVCPAQTIDQTEVPLAKQMRAQVRELLASGATREEVLAWFSAPERYGVSVLAEPPRSGFYLIAWIVPGVVVVAALAGGLLTLRAMRGRRADDDETAGPPDHDELQPYLAAVDRDLALDGRDSDGED